ncbi:uncharacterized protein LOC132759886 isoform X2 [Ruditapes philippinarum]|nr:uncharacterized protein LOC132759886 isoform X2 [Ruditapes philippinarum]XP_060607742.1 uncharacterized protein LOC132759886 isoform X2 [Ruditapes philippinarum]
MTVFTQFVAGLIVWVFAGHVVMSCSVQDITDKLTKCLSISTNDLTEPSAEDVLSSYCKSVECNLKCYLDAIGDCYTQDQFFTLNPNLLKATSRAFCKNQTETMAAFINCQWTDTSCLTNLATALTSALTEYNNANYATYKSQYCSAVTTAISCIGFTVTSSCTAALADLADNFYKASFSLTACGIQPHSYFSLYGDDVACSGRNLYQNAALWLAFVCIFVGKML